MYLIVCLYISKMNDSNNTRNERELEMFCHYKGLALSVKQYSIDLK